MGSVREAGRDETTHCTQPGSRGGIWFPEWPPGKGHREATESSVADKPIKRVFPETPRLLAHQKEKKA